MVNNFSIKYISKFENAFCPALRPNCGEGEPGRDIPVLDIKMLSLIPMPMRRRNKNLFVRRNTLPLRRIVVFLDF